MNPTPKYQKGFQSSDDIRNAVLFGYLYRKEAEKQRNVTVHFSLGDVPEVLQWLASVIISGLAWDIIKAVVKKLNRKLTKDGALLDEATKSILSDEKELEKFYNDVKEFNEHCLSITEKQFMYIRDEVVADYVGKMSGEVFRRTNQFPSAEDYMRINREASELADRMLSRNKDFPVSADKQYQAVSRLTKTC
jgi:hypothetical protein